MCPNFFQAYTMKEVIQNDMYIGQCINRKYETFLTKFRNIGLNTAIGNVS